MAISTSGKEPAMTEAHADQVSSLATLRAWWLEASDDVRDAVAGDEAGTDHPEALLLQLVCDRGEADVWGSLRRAVKAEAVRLEGLQDDVTPPTAQKSSWPPPYDPYAGMAIS